MTIVFFKLFLEIDSSVFVLHRNKQVLTTEAHKVVSSLFPKMVNGCLKLNNMSACKTRNSYTFYSRPVCTVPHDTESLSHL